MPDSVGRFVLEPPLSGCGSSRRTRTACICTGKWLISILKTCRGSSCEDTGCGYERLEVEQKVAKSLSAHVYTLTCNHHHALPTAHRDTAR